MLEALGHRSPYFRYAELGNIAATGCLEARPQLCLRDVVLVLDEIEPQLERRQSMEDWQRFLPQKLAHPRDRRLRRTKQPLRQRTDTQNRSSNRTCVKEHPRHTI
ncbi:hypothetical protein BST61_g4030 [Cercospora zeina]